MKTKADIEKEISENIAHGNSKECGEKSAKIIRKKLIVLFECRNYLETNPNEEFVKTMLYETKRKLKIIDDSYARWSGHSEYNLNRVQMKAKYNSEMGRKKVKAQLDSLNYLLS